MPDLFRHPLVHFSQSNGNTRWRVVVLSREFIRVPDKGIAAQGREGILLIVLIYFPPANLLHAFPLYICTVKVACILFASYLFSLVVLPCTDRETCQDEIKSGITLLETDNHEHDGAEQDFCSPFCICQCCNAHAQQANYFTLSLSVQMFSEPINTYISTAVQILPHTVWQPPRLS